MYIEAGYCEHIAHRLFEMQQASTPLFPGRPKLGRIVYMEEFASFEEAQKRKSELLMYTPMMKERIIRRNNPNWLNIVGTYVNANKKAVVYA
jgi:putative endonuclease